MNVIAASLQGRFGNQCLTYLFCRALAERTGSELRVAPWAGSRIFELSEAAPNLERDGEGLLLLDGGPLLRVNATEALQWSLLPYTKRYNIEVRDYCQHQAAMIYAKRQAQAWLKFRPEIAAGCDLAALNDREGVRDVIVYHLRHGDYEGYRYPMVTLDSYENACKEFGLDRSSPLAILSEESPTPHAPFIPDDLSFVVDFYRMVQAPTLLRANSSFSWVAALLGNGLVLSPVIDGLEGGKKHLCKFVAGNFPKFTNLDFVTDLFVNDV